MSKKFHLNIPEPCHENWDQMQPQNQGRFCGSCQKQVVDFTNMSDDELRNYFLKDRNQSVCGRLHTDQINRDIIIPTRTIPWIKYFFQVAIPAFLFTSRAAAQGNLKIMGDTVTIEKPKGQVAECNVVKGEVKSIEKITFKGTVTDQAGNPIPGASVVIKGTTNGCATKTDGSFIIQSDNKYSTTTLMINSVGFMPNEITYSNLPGLKEVEVTMTLENQMMGKLVVVGLIAPKRPKKPIPILTAPVDTLPKQFIVYPNPIMSGTNLNIQWRGKEEGYFQLNLVDQSGRIVHQREIWIDADARLLNFDLPKIPTGSYILSLANKKTGKIVTEKVLVQ